MKPGMRSLFLLALALLVPACSSNNGPPKVKLPPPPVPTGLSASPGSSTEIILSWTNNSIAQTSVAIERSVNDVTFVQVATVGATATGFQDLGLFPSSSYYYRVRALNGYAGSPYSNIASATTNTPTWMQLNPALTPPSPRVNVGSTNALINSKMIVC